MTRLGKHLPVIVLVIAAWAIYRPGVARPFDYVDFPEDVRVLKAHDGLIAQYGALMRVYVEHGRWKPVFNGTLAAQWSTFGTWTIGWQLTRFAVMAGALLALFALYRRLHLNAIGAFAASAFFVISPPAAMGWLRLSTPEPIGLLFLAAACHVALNPRTNRSAWILALLLVGVMWTKEIMTVAFVLPILLLLMVNDDQTLGRPKFDRQRLSALTPSIVAGCLAAVPVIWTWRSSPAESFASRYAASGFSVADILGGTVSAWLPFAPLAHPSRQAALLMVIVAFLLLIVFGWHEALKPAETRRHRQALLLLAIVVPALGALFYAPWPYYLLIYALPFMLAGALLMGYAVSSLCIKGTQRVPGVAGLAIVLTFGLAQTANESSRVRALHEAFAGSVTRVAAMADVDTVLVDVAPSQFDQRGNFGPRFKTYAWMLGLEWPHVRDVPCGADGVRGGRIVRLRLNLMCENEGGPPAIVQRYVRFEWPNPIPARDSVTVSFLTQ